MTAPAAEAHPGSATGPLAGLEAALRRSVSGEVRADAGARAAYATDASLYRQVPIAVVIPRTTDDIEAAVAACREHGAPVLLRGGGTSIGGQACNTAVVIDTSRHLTAVSGIDPDRRLARVEPGVVLDDLQTAAAPHGLMFGPDPSTHDRCTLGGMIGNNACGVHSVIAGTTAANVEALDLLLYDGTRLEVGATTEDELAALTAGTGRRSALYRDLRSLRDRWGGAIRAGFPDLPRRVSGYNLDELLPERDFHLARALTGSEGTCATVLGATLRLVERPPARALVLLGYPDVVAAAEDVPAVLAHDPVGLEGFDGLLVDAARTASRRPAGLDLLPDTGTRGGTTPAAAGGYLLVEVGGGSPGEATAGAQRLAAGTGAVASRVVTDVPAQRAVWRVREAGAGLASRLHGREHHAGWEDAAVPPDRLGAYLAEFRALLASHRLGGAIYGHFGEGCVHVRIDFDLDTGEGVAGFRRFVEEAADLVVAHGGSLSGEHGDGQARAELLPRMFGDELVGAFGAFKAAFDPDRRMNPGKIVDPAPLDADLRIGPGRQPREVATVFAYPGDGGSLARAARRCVGVGACRRTSPDGGTMCPSYMATRDERHSTRGRARLLLEMLQEGPVDGGWRDEHVRDALHLCLGCKACKTECPVGVDMATYKAEFLAHHHAGRLRPLFDYATGLIHWGLRAAALAPGLAGRLLDVPGVERSARRLLGIAPQRRLPRPAPTTFRRTFARRHRPAGHASGGGGGGAPVVLWPDTFTDHLAPHVGIAAVAVLEDAGFDVRLPDRQVCCGRPLYDHGMLHLARRQLHRTLDALDDALETGIPVVALEPSCTAVFRDELVAMLPGDPRARRLAGLVRTLAELLADAGYTPPQVGGAALLQGHCHQTALGGVDADAALLRAAGVDVEVLRAGCCGMAGAFGYAADRYGVSVAVAEQGLLPAIRAAPPDTRLVADGYSCRTQVAHLTGRTAVHLAEVLHEGLPRR